MLRKLNKDEYMQYLDSAYELALDMSRSCYPTYADGLKTRRDFDEHAARPFERENYTMLLYEQEGEALGLIQFYVLEEDKYVQPDIFCVKRGYGRALNRSKADGMKDLTFFHDAEAHAAVEDTGIRTIDTYFGYQLAL